MLRRWMKQHEVCEKLNLQSHYNAAGNSDEFVMESLITYDKLGVLVHELLAAEAWSDNIYPLIKSSVTHKSSLRAYFIVSHCPVTLVADCSSIDGLCLYVHVWRP